MEGNDAHVCCFIIQFLLLKPQDFRNRIVEFARDNSPEHWLESKWHEKHMAFHNVCYDVNIKAGMISSSYIWELGSGLMWLITFIVI